MSSGLLTWFDAIVDGLGDAIGAVLVTIGAIVAGGARQVYRNGNRIDDVEDELEVGDGKTRLECHEERMDAIQSAIEQQRRYFEGDDNDPSNDGVLKELHELKEEQKKDHQDVLERLEEIRGESED